MLDACVDRFTSFFHCFPFVFTCFSEDKQNKDKLNIVVHHMGERSMWYNNLSFKKQGGACSVSCIYPFYHVFSCFLMFSD